MKDFTHQDGGQTVRVVSFLISQVWFYEFPPLYKLQKEELRLTLNSTRKRQPKAPKTDYMQCMDCIFSMIYAVYVEKNDYICTTILKGDTTWTRM